ncbi:hypothetical protein ACIRFH_30510 [Streptomyces sp. NPDC093586]|uniref:hypothetical protein n=1 Tax=Streptomyces sp. NPDC093586 TaxID=3366042 RepID=UPI0038011645
MKGMEFSRTARRRQRFPAAVVTVLLLTLSACGEEEHDQDYSVPHSICGTKINAALFSPFLPPGDKLTTKSSTPSPNVTKCGVSVDGKLVAQVSQEWWDSMGILEFSRGLSLDSPKRQTEDGLYAYSENQAFGKTTGCDNKDHRGQVLYTAIQFPGSEHHNADSMKKLITEYTASVQQSSSC